MAISVDELKELIQAYEEYNDTRIDDLIYHVDMLYDLLNWYETKFLPMKQSATNNIKDTIR